MVSVTIGSDLARKFADATGPVYVYDEQGRMLGIFRSELYQQLREEALAACPASEDELKRRAARWEGRPLADILEDLERRAPSS
ncbi:MAG TPA: hypothetical protein VF170_01735 [Planctomycetaceae bacterium]